jgi:hypothetical protein
MEQLKDKIRYSKPEYRILHGSKAICLNVGHGNPAKSE